MRRVPVDPLAAELYERPLDPTEFDDRLRRALSDDERMRDLRDLVTWFRSRYPTVEDRLAYARRKYAEIVRNTRST